MKRSRTQQPWLAVVLVAAFLLGGLALLSNQPLRQRLKYVEKSLPSIAKVTQGVPQQEKTTTAQTIAVRHYPKNEFFDPSTLQPQSLEDCLAVTGSYPDDDVPISKREVCLVALAEHLQDASVCEHVEAGNFARVQTCYLSAAVGKKDYRLCLEAPEKWRGWEEARQECLKGYSVYIHDMRACEAMQPADYRVGDCRENVVVGLARTQHNAEVCLDDRLLDREKYNCILKASDTDQECEQVMAKFFASGYPQVNSSLSLAQAECRDR